MVQVKIIETWMTMANETLYCRIRLWVGLCRKNNNKRGIMTI